MHENVEKMKPYSLKIEGQGSWSVEDTFLQKQKASAFLPGLQDVENNSGPFLVCWAESIPVQGDLYQPLYRYGEWFLSKSRCIPGSSGFLP